MFMLLLSGNTPDPDTFIPVRQVYGCAIMTGGESLAVKQACMTVTGAGDAVPVRQVSITVVGAGDPVPVKAIYGVVMTASEV